MNKGSIVLAVALLMAAATTPAVAECDDGDSDSDCGAPTTREREPVDEERQEKRRDLAEGGKRDGGEAAEDCEGAF